MSDAYLDDEELNVLDEDMDNDDILDALAGMDTEEELDEELP